MVGGASVKLSRDTGKKPSLGASLRKTRLGTTVRYLLRSKRLCCGDEEDEERVDLLGEKAVEGVAGTPFHCFFATAVVDSAIRFMEEEDDDVLL